MRIHFYSCPSCSSAVNFRSADTNVAVCPQCSLPLQRWEDDVLKPLRDLPLVHDFLTPIQIGTTGIWKEKKFTVIGRIYCQLQEEHINLWSIYFESGALHLLAESFGHFAVYEKITLEKQLPAGKLSSLSFGLRKREIDIGKLYLLESKDNCSRITVEGEAWVFDLNGVFSFYEVAASDGDRLALLDLQMEHYLYFRKHYSSFESFNFQHLRPMKIGALVKIFTCTRCSSAIEIRSFPLSQSFCCGHCGAAFSYKKGSVVYRKRMSLGKTPAMSLYTEGLLKGVDYQLVGIAEKEDAEGYGWREYTLFNPERGYAFLSEYAGHWIFLKEKKDAPVLVYDQPTGFQYGEKDFAAFNKYTFTTNNAVGEFPGDAFSEGSVSCREYIAPPELWAREFDDRQICWYHGESISKEELYAAFGDRITLPYQFGVGAVQPVKGYVNLPFLRISLIGIAVLFFILYVLSMGLHEDRTVYNESLSLPDTATTYSIVTPKFQLDKWRSNLEIGLKAPVSNNWFEVNITLVNADNGKEYTIEEGVEYYSGYEDGETWSEGSGSTQQLLHSIPRGTYFMEIVGSKPSGSSISYFTLTAKYDVPMPRNFFVFIIAALLPGLALYLYLWNKERARWENSPFSPFPAKIDDDE